MVIEEVSVENFRNLTGQLIKLNPKMSFAVGENNLGKTNFLDFLFILFSKSSISKKDFNDSSKPIVAVLKLRLTAEEAGLLGEYFDSTDHLTLTIRMIAESPDSEILFIHEESGGQIPAEYIRRINLFRYSSTNSISSNQGFGRAMGVGKVLATLVDDNKLHFKRLGGGVQYVALLMLSIVESMTKMGEKQLSESVVVDDAGRRSFSCIITLDEPEAHLHPYMQRRLIKALAGMSEGKDDSFGKLLKEFFDIDVFTAQIVVVTHSPNVLRQTHVEMVRFYDAGSGTVKVANGVDAELDFSTGKHFIDRFEFIREAFFVKKVLLVEGASEASALPRFALTMGIDIDDCGILVLQVGGNGSIPPARKLLDAFEIENMSIEDKDDGTSTGDGKSRITKARDFEEELVNALINASRQDLFLKLLRRYGVDPNRLVIQKGLLNKYVKKIGYQEFDENIPLTRLIDGDKLLDAPETKAVMYTWLSKEKSAVLGAEIGDLLPLCCIPDCYQAILRDLAQLDSPEPQERF